MSNITVVCDECDQRVEGLIDVATTPNGEAFIMSGGFYLYENGVSCDGCVQGNSRSVNTGSDRDGGDDERN